MFEPETGPEIPVVIDAAGDEPLYQGSNAPASTESMTNWDFGPVSGSNIRLEHGISSSYFTLTTCDHHRNGLPHHA